MASDTEQGSRPFTDESRSPEVAVHVSVPGPVGGDLAKPQEKKTPKDFELRPLPSAENIWKAIPAHGGITITELVSKFRKDIDESNVRLFTHMVETLGTFRSLRLFRHAQMIPNEQIADIYKEARTPAAPRPKLKPGQRQEYHTEQTDSHVTFCGTAELARGASKILQPYFYRIQYETSATLSSYVSKDTHVKHREDPLLKLKEENAFQSIGKPAVRDLTRERIERHLQWNKKKDPSSFISAFNHIGWAAKRARFHSDESARIGQRILCVRIITAGLIPATVIADIAETVTTITGGNVLGTREIETKPTRKVHIPIWVRSTSLPDNPTTMSLQDLIDSGAEVWMSITEIRMSDLRAPCHRGHDYEWLAWGKIPKSCVTRVMSYDGKRLYQKDPGWIIHSTGAMDDWVFDWGKEMWVLDAKKAKIARTEHKAKLYGKDPRLEKRKEPEDEERNRVGEESYATKRQKTTVEPEEPQTDVEPEQSQDEEGSGVGAQDKSDREQTIFSTSSEGRAGSVLDNRGCCPKCGQTLPLHHCGDYALGAATETRVFELPDAIRSLLPPDALRSLEVENPEWVFRWLN